jgi:hypothetical protein
MELDLPLSHYQSRSMKVLSPTDQDLYLNSEKQYITVEIDKADHEFIKANKLNMNRIAFFIIKEWLAKKRIEWEV